MSENENEMQMGTSGGFPAGHRSEIGPKFATGTPSASALDPKLLTKLKWNPENMIAPFEPRLNWERREIHAHAGDGGWASRLISAVLQDIGMKTEERDGCIFGIPEDVRKPKLWLCTRLSGNRSAEIAMLLCAARAVMSEIPEAPVGFGFLMGEAELPLPCVLLRIFPELTAGNIRCTGVGEELRAALFGCMAELHFEFEEGKRECTVLTLGTGGVKRFEKDLTLLPAGACAMLVPALLLDENRG